MTIVGYPVREAAKLAGHSYNVRGERNLKTQIADECKINGVEATLMTNGFLLIPGSNSLADYFKFNLRVWNIGHAKYDLRTTKTVRGASGTIWHQGFFAHAKTIYDWMGDRRPVLIIGHSLGAASAQILSKSWRRTSIGFAAPRPRKARGQIANDELSLSINRSDDLVPGVPSSFSHMGTTRKLLHKNRRPGLNHSMHAYIDALDNHVGADKVPEIWHPLQRR